MALTIDQVVDQVFETPADTPTPEPTPTPAEASPEAPVDTVDPVPDADSAPVPAPASALSDDTLVSVTIDGKPVTMPWGEAKRSISHTAASTQRFQQAAELRKQAEAERAQAQADIAAAAQVKAQLDAIIRDPQKLAAFYMAQQSQQRGAAPAAPAAVDPNALMQQMLSQADTLVNQRLAEAQQRERAAGIERDLTSYTESLIASHPVLSAVPGFSDKVYELVATANPSSIEQAKEWIAMHVDEVKSKLSSTLGETAKASAVAKAKAASATERGGSPVLPSPKTYASLDDPQRHLDMIALLDSLPD